MKKVLALSLFFAIIFFSASAQTGMHERIRKQRIEQRLQNRYPHFKQHDNANLRKEMLHRRIVKQRAMGDRNINRGDGRQMRIKQMQQRRKMMIRRHGMHRRVI
jgi:hypothetical protein